MREGASRGWVIVVQTVVLVGLFLGASAALAPRLPKAQYVSDVKLTSDQFKSELYSTCLDDDNGAPSDNNEHDVPSIAVVGDSISSQTRKPALASHEFRWEFFTHCSETFRTSMDGPRFRHAIDAQPDVLVIALGTNSLTVDGTPPDQIEKSARDELKSMLDATDSIACRVLVNLTPQSESNDPSPNGAARGPLVTQLNAAMANEHRPGLYLADWASRVTGRGSSLLGDGVHLTRAGINERLDLIADTARDCLLHR